MGGEIMEEKQIEQREKIKITKGMTGKYGWEVSVLGNPLVNLDTIKHLEDLNKELKEKFGCQNE